MQIKYGCTYWGSDYLTPSEFVSKVIDAGYNGVEVFLQPPDKISAEFIVALDEIRKQKPDFFLIALQLTIPVKESVKEYIAKMENNFLALAELNPLFINSHTGKDYYSFEDNCRVIEAAQNISLKTGVRVMHETHRGRFSFHAATLLPYLNKFPEMNLVGDFSHFCTVSESMLEDQQDILNAIIPHIGHIHARVGYEEGPQVNNPAAPEWKEHVQTYMNWWQQIVQYRESKGDESFTITTEFGPFPYMPTEPFTKKPLSSQWNNNLIMLQELKKKFG